MSPSPAGGAAPAHRAINTTANFHIDQSYSNRHGTFYD
jgi:hypothetical protein